MEEFLVSRGINSFTASSLADPNTLVGQDRPTKSSTKQHLYVLSANDRESLKRHVSLVAEYVKERPVTLYPQLARSLAFTLGQRRSVLPWKFAVPALNSEQLVYNLKDTADAYVKPAEEPKIGFIFTGQGSQWPTMGKSLYRTYPAYSLAVRRADRILIELGASWSLVDELEKSQENSIIHSAHISQPACTALQCALVDLLSSWAIHPFSVTGHSSGEIAAAYAAGILSLEVCMAIAYYRGVVAKTLEDFMETPGGMLAVGANQEDTQALIDASSYGEAIIACINSPNSMTISGDADQISQIQKVANDRLIWNRRLKVDVAYHSHHMSGVADKYTSLLGQVEPNLQTSVEFHSSLKGARVEPSMLTSTYWVENLCSPVLFSQATQSLCGISGDSTKQCVNLIIEIGPHSALQGPVRQILQSVKGSSRKIQSMPSLIRNEDSVSAMLQLAARLFMSGCQIQMGNVNFPTGESPKILTDLPTYQWNHERGYWHEIRANQERQVYPSQRHDLLGIRVPDCSALEPQWRNILRVDDVPWLREHKVDDLIVFPLTGYLCMAMEACRQKASWSGTQYTSIKFREISVYQALAIDDSKSIELRLSLTPFDEGPRSSSDRWSQFSVSSWTSERGWWEHCRGLIEPGSADVANPIESDVAARSRTQSCADDRFHETSRCTNPIDADFVYRDMAVCGFEYGRSLFRQMAQVMSGPSRLVHNVKIPDSSACMPAEYESKYVIHPITLDNICHSILAFKAASGGRFPKVPFLPVAIRELTVMLDIPTQPGAIFQVYTRVHEIDKFSRRITYDMDARDLGSQSNTCGVVIRGFTEVPVLQSQAGPDVAKARCLRVRWEPCVTYFPQSRDSKAIHSSPLAPEDGNLYQQRRTLTAGFIGSLAHQNPGLRILEVSGGTTDTTVPILEVLGGAAEEPARFAQYDFTDTCANTLEIARAKLAPWGELVSCKTLDLEVSPQDQGFEPESYDVVVLASGDPFDTAFTQRAMAHVRSLFRSGGKLIIIEDTNLNGLVRSLPSSPLDRPNDHSYLTNGGDSLRNGDSHLLNGDNHHVDGMLDSSPDIKR